MKEGVWGKWVEEGVAGSVRGTVLGAELRGAGMPDEVLAFLTVQEGEELRVAFGLAQNVALQYVQRPACLPPFCLQARPLH